MIYLWRIPENVKNKEIGDYNRNISADRFLLIQGRILMESEFQPTPWVEFEIPIERVRKFDCLVNNALVPLVNQRLRRLLEELAPDDVQFMSAMIKCRDGEIDDYHFLNVTHLVKGLDHENSIYSTILDTPHIMGFGRAVYFPTCLGQHHLARDEEYKVHLLASETIKQKFFEHKIKGARIISPDKYYGYE